MQVSLMRISQIWIRMASSGYFKRG